MEVKPIELTYWPLRGRGTLVSHFLAAIDVPFNFNRIKDRESWIAQKTELMKTFPLVNLPYIVDPNNNNHHQAETQAILNYLASKYKPEAGPSFEELPEFMTINGVAHDMFMGVILPVYGAKAKEEVAEKVKGAKQRMGSKLVFLENHFKTNDWVFKNRFTYADVSFALLTEILNAMEKELGFEFWTEAERTFMTAHMDRVNTIEGIKKFRSSDKFLERPYLAPFAVWK
jgi:glutathione S-transferase